MQLDRHHHRPLMKDLDMAEYDSTHALVALLYPLWTHHQQIFQRMYHSPGIPGDLPLEHALFAMHQTSHQHNSLHSHWQEQFHL